MKNAVITLDPFGRVEIETRGVNSNTLTGEVIIFTTETLNNTFFHDFSEEHDREVVVNYLEHFYGVLVDANLIEQFDIIFDKRNNTRAEMNIGKYTVESKFKQKNCLNHTSVIFHIGGKK